MSAIMVAALLASMCTAAMAAMQGATPAEADTATVTIQGIKANAGGTFPTVTLYQIVDAVYDTDAGFTGYAAVTGVTIASPTSPTAAEVETIWKNIKDGTLTGLTTATMNVANGTATADVGAGIWVAVVTGSDAAIYNPMMVSAFYKDENGAIVISGGTIEEGATYTLAGGQAVAKISTPTVEKTVTGTTADGDDKTASVGDTLNYTITPVLPTYPSNATNKTFFVADTMGTGLTFLQSSLAIKLGTTECSISNGVVTAGTTKIADIAVTTTGFNINFIYDALGGFAPTVTYSAVINDDAVVGGSGNANDVTLFYANDPTKGQSHDTTTIPDPSPDNGLTETTDKVTVYTYQVAFQKKDGNGEDAAALAGAKFGIYSDEACTKLIDVVTTNAEGYAASSKVEAGTYYIKELEAPTGFTLNEKVYSVTANKTSATTTVTTTKRTYTTDITLAIDYDAEAKTATQVGWLKDGVFYNMQVEGGVAAYLASETATGTVTTTPATGAGTALLGEAIPNTKVGELPSTGGIGTYVFIIGGVAVMGIALALIAANRRRAARSK